MTAEKQEIMTAFDAMDARDRSIFLRFIDLFTRNPGFVLALKAATPAGEKVPPWDITERLVDEWDGGEAKA